MSKKISEEKIKTWIVTGASQGIGYELCRQLLDRGYNVVALSRKKPDLRHENLLCLAADVTKPQTVKNAIKKAIERFERIDVLFNNAGISANITLEEENIEHVRQVMEVNFFGAYNMISSLIEHFRKNKNGTIICNTSQAGLSCRALGSAYVSSKHAIEGLASVCWHETKSFCRVMCIELGFFKGTNIQKNALNKKTNIEEYKNLSAFYIKYKRDFENDLRLAIKYIIEQTEEEKLPRHLMLGKDSIIQTGAEIETLKADWKNSKKRALKCSKSTKKTLSNKIKKTIRFIKNKEYSI